MPVNSDKCVTLFIPTTDHELSTSIQLINGHATFVSEIREKYFVERDVAAFYEGHLCEYPIPYITPCGHLRLILIGFDF